MDFSYSKRTLDLQAQLLRTNSVAVATWLRTSSNAYAYGDRTNSNALVLLALPFSP